MAGFLPGGIGYGRPAGIPDTGGVLSPQQPDQGGGIFGSYAPQAGGIFAALMDAGSRLSGSGTTDNFARYHAQNQDSQMRQQLLAGLNSDDPATRQQAYSYAALAGIDTKPFQQQAANKALGPLMQSMQPSTQTVAPTSAPLNIPAAQSLPQLPPQTVQGGNFSFDAPGLKLPDALAVSGSPELQQQYAPKLIDSQIAADAEASKPYDLSPGQHRFLGSQEIASLPEKATPNSPFNPDGSPNLAFQKYEQGKISAQQGPAWANVGLSKERLAYDQQNKAIDPKAVDLGVSYFISNGGKFPPTARSPALQNAIMAAASDRMAASGQSMDDLVRNHQTLAAGAKAVTAFDTGKQGDTVRSLNVSVQHLDKLRELGVALKNGDVNMINAARQKFAEAFGGAAPTNWDAAKAIVADEVAKGVIGGQTAQSDRETLAATLKSSRSPEQADGAINTFQDLLGGQLRGLRQQYKSSTGREDFNGKLFDETVRRLDPAKAAPVVPSALPRLPVSNSGWTVKRR